MHLDIGLWCELQIEYAIIDGAIWERALDPWPVGMIDADEGHPVEHEAVRNLVVVVGCHEAGVLLLASVLFLAGVLGSSRPGLKSTDCIGIGFASSLGGGRGVAFFGIPSGVLRRSIARLRVQSFLKLDQALTQIGLWHLYACIINWRSQ